MGFGEQEKTLEKLFSLESFLFREAKKTSQNKCTHDLRKGSGTSFPGGLVNDKWKSCFPFNTHAITFCT